MKIQLNYLGYENKSTILINLLEAYGNAVIKKIEIDYVQINKLSNKIYHQLSQLQKRKEINPTNSIIDQEIEKEVKYLGKELFTLLFEEIKEKIIRTKDKDLLISFEEKLYYIPFEILFDGNDFLCLKFNFAKQVISENINPVETTPLDQTLKAVILSNPTLDKNLEPILHKERNQLYNLLGKKKKINIAPPVVGERITVDYFSHLKEMNIIYYAGHSHSNPSGEYKNESLKESGIDDYGLKLSNDSYLTPQLIEGFDLSHTKLFYLNSCESALPPHGNEKNLLTSFLKAGVQNIIGNLIEVHNEPASFFALSFYEYLLNGHTIAESIRLSRLKAIKKYGTGELIWLITTFFGNPSWKLPSINLKKIFSYASVVILSISITFYSLYSFLNRPKVEKKDVPDVLLSQKKPSNKTTPVTQRKDGIYKEYHTNGKVKEENPYKNGKINGIRKFYYVNSQLKEEILYKDGLQNGAGKSFDVDGVLLSEMSFKNGKPHGVWKTYYKRERKTRKIYSQLDGTFITEIPYYKPKSKKKRLKSILVYKNGKQHGIHKFYDEIGNLTEEVPYENDQKHGVVKGHYLFENGLKYTRPYTNNKKNGIHKDYYSKDYYAKDNYAYVGKIEKETPYVDNQKHGIEKWYRKNGQLRKITPYAKGKENGLFRRYYVNGKLEGKVPYKNGQAHGTAKWYYENGQLKSVIPYNNDKRHGYYKHFYENGKLKEEASYENGLIHGLEKKYYRNGKLMYETLYIQGKRNGAYKYYNEKGKLRLETPYKNDQKHGLEKSYHENGRLERETPFSNGKEHGVQKSYHRNGTLYGERPYKNGKDHGVWKGYRENGQLDHEWSYREGKKHGVRKSYYLNGKTLEEISYENDEKNGIEKIYYKNGKLKKETHYKNGKKHGSIKEYYDNGQLEYEKHGWKDKSHGAWKYYDKNGKLIREEFYEYGRFIKMTNHK